MAVKKLNLGEKILAQRDAKTNTYKLFYPFNCYGDNNRRLTSVAQISIQKDGKPVSKFPMVPTMRKKLVQKRFLKNNETFEEVKENASITIYVPLNEKDKVIVIDRKYRQILDAIMRELDEYYDKKVYEQENSKRKFKYADPELEKMLHSDEDKEAEINKFLKSFDAFEVVIEDKPMIVGRIDYAGFSGERQFEILRVNFLNFDKEKMPVSDIHSVQEKIKGLKMQNNGPYPNI